MTKKLLALGVGLGLIGAQPAFAAWTGEAELGAAISGGNTETTVVNAKLDMDAAADRWRHNIFGDVFYSEDNSVKTAERFAIGYKPRYFMTEKDYVFGLLRYDQDEFGGYDGRWTEVLGYGRQILNNKVHYLDGEIGVGARQTEFTNDDSSDEVIGFLGLKYVGRISDTARFSETLRAEIGEDNTFIESITGLGMTVTDSVSAKLTYTVRHNTDIEGAQGKKTDSITGVNVVYGF